MGSRRLRAAAVAVVSAVVLTSCGIHPGAAAQVGDVSISDSALQRNTHGFCDLINAINRVQQGTTPSIPLRTALLSALNTLVVGQALDQLAQRNNVDLTQAEIGNWQRALPIDLGKVPKQRRADLQQTLDRVARNALLVEKLGRVAYERQNPGAPPPSSDQLRQLGQQMANAYLKKVGAETNPRYGQALDTRRLPGTGSLSVAVSQEAVQARSIPQANSRMPDAEMCF